MADFDKLWNYGDPEATRSAFLDLLPTVAEPDLRAQLLTQIARTHSLQRQFEQAHTILDEVEAQLKVPMRLARVRYWLERGRTFNSSGDRKRACVLFEQAFTLAAEVGADFFAVDAAHMLGIAAEPDKQLGWNVKALEMARNSAEINAQKWQGSLLNNIGWTHFFNENYPAALIAFSDCRKFYASIDRRQEERIARYSIAKTQRMLGDYQQALATQLRLHDEHASEDAIDGYVEEEIAENLLALGRDDDAAQHFAAAYAELSQDPWLVANEPKRLARLKQHAT